MRFNEREIRKVMPSDTIFVSIIREPGELFKSTYRFFYSNVAAFKRGPEQNDPDSPEIWLNNTKHYFREKERTLYWFYAKNHEMFDFGYDALMDDDDKIEQTVKKIDQVFDFILIANYMSESLVLLADMLCCPLADVSSVVLNANADLSKKDESRMKRISKKAREWNKADSALFDYFNKSLWRKIEKFGFQKMQKEVMRLQTINQNLLVKCSAGKKSYDHLTNDPWKDMKYYQPRGVKIVSYDLKAGAELNETCVYALAPEKYTSSVQDLRQKERQIQLLRSSNRNKEKL